MIKMKDSGIPWIGQIPEDWEVAKYKFFATSGMGETILGGNLVEDGIPVYSATQNNTVFGYVKSSSLRLNKNDFVIPARGNSIGCVTIVKDNEATATQTTIYSKLNDKINYKFLYYCCVGLKDVWFYFEDTAIPQITVNQVQNNKVPLPPKEIQQKIVEILDKKCGQIDELVSLEENEIEKLKEYKTSLITKVVTKGLDPNAKMKDSGTWQLDRIPTNWQLKKLLYYLEMPITDGPHETPTLRDDGIPFISAESIKNNSIDFSKMRGYISNEYNSIISKKYSPKTNDIFIIKSGATTGNVAYVKDFVNFNIWSPLAVIRVNKYNYWKFIFYVLQSIYFQQQIQLSWSFGTQQNLSMRVLETLKIASPDIKVQHQIVECLDKKCEEIDNLIKIKQEKIEKMKEYKKSLIYQYVTGKKEV